MEGCHLCCESGPHHFIPQRPYVCRQGARREGIYEAKKVAFRKGNQCGILVGDAVLKRYEGLENRDSRPFEGIDVADQGTLRIEVSTRHCLISYSLRKSGQVTLLGTQQ